MTDGKNIGAISQIQKYICQYVTFMISKIKWSILNYSGTKQWRGGLVPHTCGTHTFIKVQVSSWKSLSANKPKHPFCKQKPDSHKQAQSSGDATHPCRVVSCWRHPDLLPVTLVVLVDVTELLSEALPILPTSPPPTSSSNSKGWLTPPTMIWFRVSAGSDQSSFINRFLMLKI